MRPTALAMFAGLLLSTQALAQEGGVPVTVRVLKPDGAPLATASVRHPQEAERHPVNAATGEWTESILYMPDGSEFLFTAGTVLELEISAPGYVNQPIRYEIKKRKNLVPIVLQPMKMVETEDDLEGPVIQFGRDKPLE